MYRVICFKRKSEKKRKKIIKEKKKKMSIAAVTVPSGIRSFLFSVALFRKCA